MRIVRREFEAEGRKNARIHGLIDAVLMMAIGLQLLRAEDTFLTSPIYKVMGEVMAENKWGSILFALGSLRSFVILYGIRHPENSKALLASTILSLVSVGTFLGLSLTFFFVNPLGLLCLANIAFAAHDFSNFWTISRMAGVSRGRERAVNNGRTR